MAIVGEDGREFYAERNDFELALCSDFARDVVLPQLGMLPGRAMSSSQMRDELMSWLLAVPLKPKPVLCYDFEGDLDLIERLMGAPLPRGWKAENVEQRIDAMRRAEYLEQHGSQHHALHDARANALAFI